jgi:hypothetical protein
MKLIFGIRVQSLPWSNPLPGHPSLHPTRLGGEFMAGHRVAGEGPGRDKQKVGYLYDGILEKKKIKQTF